MDDMDEGPVGEWLDSMTLPDMLEWACDKTEELYFEAITIQQALNMLSQASAMDVLTREQDQRCIHLQARLMNLAAFLSELYPKITRGVAGYGGARRRRASAYPDHPARGCP
jgi:hypothetical protein